MIAVMRETRSRDKKNILSKTNNYIYIYIVTATVCFIRVVHHPPDDGRLYVIIHLMIPIRMKQIVVVF
jgi:hypothetical protein